MLSASASDTHHVYIRIGPLCVHVRDILTHTKYNISPRSCHASLPANAPPINYDCIRVSRFADSEIYTPAPNDHADASAD